MFHRLFHHRTDERVAQINADIAKTTKEATKAAKDLKRLLEKNGVTLLIVTAGGGNEH